MLGITSGIASPTAPLSITGTQSPFFDQGDMRKGYSKDRPCIALHASDPHSVPLFVPMYVTSKMLASNKPEERVNTVLQLSHNDDISPPNRQGLSHVDCSKVFSIYQRNTISLQICIVTESPPGKTGAMMTQTKTPRPKQCFETCRPRKAPRTDRQSSREHAHGEVPALELFR